MKKIGMSVMIILISIFVFYFIWNEQYANAGMMFIGDGMLMLYLFEIMDREKRLKRKNDRPNNH